MGEPETNKKWDGLLRAYAKKPQPETVLHPVSRKALHAEVARTFGAEKTSKAKAGALSRWWIRWPLAVGFAACAVLMIVQNRRFEETRAQEKFGMGSELAKAPAPIAEREKARGAEAPAGRARTLGAMAATARAPQPATPLAAAAGGPYFLSGTPAPAVLQAFQVQRNGSNVMVTDRDGSIYTGQVVAPPTRTVAGYSFTVNGMNRSIQQAVQFDARLDSPTNEVAADALATSRDFKQNGAARVSGTARVGSTNQIHIEAMLPNPR
jgi:hypothetical protein